MSGREFGWLERELVYQGDSWGDWGGSWMSGRELGWLEGELVYQGESWGDWGGS